MRYEIAISVLELAMSGVIIVQMLALFLLMFNNKILKNALSKKKELSQKKLQKLSPNQEKKKEITKDKKLPANSRRNTPLRQRDDHGL